MPPIKTTLFDINISCNFANLLILQIKIGFLDWFKKYTSGLIVQWIE